MTDKRLISFIYSADVAYVIVLHPYQMDVYYDDAFVTSVITPYSETENFDLHVAQVGDVMWCVHSAHAPRKLSRTAASTFELEKISFTDGPFLTRNDLVDPYNLSPTTVECSVTDVDDYGTLTASAGIFDSGHVGALYKLTHPRDTTFVSTTYNTTSDVLDAKGVVHFTTRGTWTGTVKLQRNANEAGWEDFRTYKGSNDRNIQLTFTEKEDNVQFRIVPSPMTILFKGELLTEDGHHTGIAKVIGYGSSKVVAIQVLTRIESTDSTIRWYEGAWSDYRGWPASLTFFQNRCVYAGALASSERTIGAELQYPTLVGVS